jgi:hypothetical protein
MVEKVNLKQRASSVSRVFEYLKVGLLNDHMLNIITAQNRTLDFHLHDDSDEMFYVIEGRMQIEFEDGFVDLSAYPPKPVSANAGVLKNLCAPDVLDNDPDAGVQYSLEPIAPRRLVRIAEAFGANGTVHSICEDDFAPLARFLAARASQLLSRYGGGADAENVTLSTDGEGVLPDAGGNTADSGSTDLKDPLRNTDGNCRTDDFTFDANGPPRVTC